MAQLIVGPPATGLAFFDRELELKHIWSRLNSSHLLIAAPRRFGKTSIFLNMKEKPQNGYSVHFVDLQGFSTPMDFITEVTAKLMEDQGNRKKMGQYLKRLPVKLIDLITERIDEVNIAEFKIKFRESLGAENWQPLANQLMEAVQGLDKRLIIILDELPLLIRRMADRDKNETELFLYWQRQVRLSEQFKNIRFIIGGSIGIEHILSRAQCVAAINDLEKVTIKPFQPETSRLFVTELLQNQNLPATDETIREILDVIDIHIPYFIQIMVSALSQEYMNKHLSQLTPQTVRDVYYNRVLGVECRTYFEHYYQRLNDYYTGAEVAAAREILKRLSIVGEMDARALYTVYLAATGGATGASEENYHNLIADLENDFYLEYDGEKKIHHFKTRVLRDWWKKYFGALS